jgi:hypothetical protein
MMEVAAARWRRQWPLRRGTVVVRPYADLLLRLRQRTHRSRVTPSAPPYLLPPMHRQSALALGRAHTSSSSPVISSNCRERQTKLVLTPSDAVAKVRGGAEKR